MAGTTTHTVTTVTKTTEVHQWSFYTDASTGDIAAAPAVALQGYITQWAYAPVAGHAPDIVGFTLPDSVGLDRLGGSAASVPPSAPVMGAPLVGASYRPSRVDGSPVVTASGNTTPDARFYFQLIVELDRV